MNTTGTWLEFIRLVIEASTQHKQNNHYQSENAATISVGRGGENIIDYRSNIQRVCEWV